MLCRPEAETPAILDNCRQSDCDNKDDNKDKERDKDMTDIG